MPKVAYSQEDRVRIRQELAAAALELIAKNGIQRTTVEQIYKKAGISRTFFYSFFPTKEDLIVEALYLQQPRILAYVKRLMEDPALSWREAVRQFLHACCYGEEYGIAVLTIEEQQHLFRHLSPESCRVFREKQQRLFGQICAILFYLEYSSCFPPLSCAGPETGSSGKLACRRDSASFFFSV